ncbi:hypothetical protein RRG08_037594 [Elysia crispata]|uniref:Uncharacterized protein n=1 Tax=Elysia crispata TaxID=231223 RepID=A0AAE1CYZ8_9GAST|nr:hypothetical protein RRG08_037594 [Elysia crispata]
MEITAAFLGTISITPVVACFVPKTSSFSSSFIESFGQLGAVGMIGVAGACLLYFLGKGSSRVIPSLSRRADVNVAAAAAWQRLAQTTRSYRIRLDNPKLDVKDYATWYERMLVEREKLCAMASIPQSTYNKFEDPDLVYDKLIRRRQIFLHILEQERLEPSDFKAKVKEEPKEETRVKDGLKI